MTQPLFSKQVPLITTVIVAALIWIGCDVTGQPHPLVSAHVKATLGRWYQADCALGTFDTLRASIRAIGDTEALYQSFMFDYVHGPDSAHIDTIRAHAALWHAEVDSFEVGEDSSVIRIIQVVDTTSVASFQQQEAARYVSGYRSRALLGLAVMNGYRGPAFVDSLSQTGPLLGYTRILATGAKQAAALP